MASESKATARPTNDHVEPQDDGGSHRTVPKGCAVYASKADMYRVVTEELHALVDPAGNTPLVTALSNAAALLFYGLNSLGQDCYAMLHAAPVNWVGFYLLEAPPAEEASSKTTSGSATAPNKLFLGPFQGKVACQEIRIGKGVCGTAVAERRSIVVPDVHRFPGHIACDGASESEIVVLLREPPAPGVPPGHGNIVGLLDIDSSVKGRFRTPDGDEADDDLAPLERFCAYLGEALKGQFTASLKVAGTTHCGHTGTCRHHDVTHATALAVEATRLPTTLTAFRVTAAAPSSPAVPASRSALLPASSATPGVVLAKQPTVTAVDATRVTSRIHRGWEFTSRSRNLMLDSERYPALEALTGAKQLPEIIFGENEVNFTFPVVNHPQRAVLQFHVSAQDYLKAAAHVHRDVRKAGHGAEATAGGGPGAAAAIALDPLQVAVAQRWQERSHGRGGATSTTQAVQTSDGKTQAPKKPPIPPVDFATFDPDIDWAFRSTYNGTWRVSQMPHGGSDATAVVSVPNMTSTPDVHTGIDYDTLKRRDLDILSYDAIDLFEDDLHDNGIVKYSVKYRVMGPCFFCLLRYKLRLDGVQLRIRDVRIFHKFGDSAIVLNVEERRLDAAAAPSPAAASVPLLSTEDRSRLIHKADDETPGMDIVYRDTIEITVPTATAGTPH